MFIIFLVFAYPAYAAEDGFMIITYRTQDLQTNSLDINIIPAPASPLDLPPVSLQVLVLLCPEHVHLGLPEHRVPGRVLGHGQGGCLLLREVGAELVLHHLHLDHLASSEDRLGQKYVAKGKLFSSDLKRVRASWNDERLVVILGHSLRCRGVKCVVREKISCLNMMRIHMYD